MLLNLSDLEKLSLNDVNHQTLVAKSAKNEKELIKILGNGTISKSVNVKVNKISQTAKAAIEKPEEKWR